MVKLFVRATLHKRNSLEYGDLSPLCYSWTKLIESCRISDLLIENGGRGTLRCALRTSVRWVGHLVRQYEVVRNHP